MMNIKEKTYLLIADRLLGKTDSEIYVDWAVEMISNGYESENITILAGLDSSDSEEREKYLRLSLNDLKIDYPDNDEELITIYSHNLANEVISGKIKPRVGLAKMAELIYASDYSARFNSFGDLEEDIDYFNESGVTIFNSGITKENIDEFIKNEFILFLEFEKLPDKDIRTKAKCKKCGSIMKPLIKTKWRLKRPFRIGYYCCSKCFSQDLILVRTQEGKKLLLEEIKKTNANS